MTGTTTTLRRGQGARLLALAILLAAAAARLWALGQIPPGLGHDEVSHWLITQEILAGRHAIYFTAAYGHEPLFEYLLTASVSLLGNNWLGLRFLTVALGMLGLAVTVTLARRLFGARTALATGALLALNFWPVSFARVGLRAILLPLIAALAIYLVFRALDLPRPPDRAPSIPRFHWAWLWAGLLVGLSIYAYMAARILPVILACVLVYTMLVYPAARRAWPGMVVMATVAVAVAAPLATWLSTHPGAEYRVAEVRQPLDRLLSGDPSLAWNNLLANLGFFTFRGDPWPRYTIPGRPVFTDLLSAALFYAGLFIAVRHWRDPRYGFLLIWQVGALGPSVASADAPSAIRGILGLVVTFVFPALAVAWLLDAVPRWLVKGPSRPKWVEVGVQWGLVALALGPVSFLSLRDYFIIWPQDPVARFDYQSDLMAVGKRLDELPGEAPVAVAGLSVETMDGPSLALAARRDTKAVRLCDTRETIVVPAGRDVWLFVPHVVPFDADLRERLLRWGAAVERDPDGAFTGYHLRDDDAAEQELTSLDQQATLPDGTPVALPASFGGVLTLLGYERYRQADPLAEVLLTYWRVEQVPETPLKIFAHVLGTGESPVVQDDGLGSVPAGWAAGDLIVQKHSLSLAGLAPGEYTVQVGLYRADSSERLTVGAADRLRLYRLAVTE